MSLDMYGTIDVLNESTPEGGVTLITPGQGAYTGPAGRWEDGVPEERNITLVTIQQADMKTADFIMSLGGVVQPTDLRVVYINDGTMLYPDDDGRFAQTLRFSDGRREQVWRVRMADNRPWRNYCKAVVERYRDER